MEKINIAPFCVGDKVVCIDDAPKDSRPVYIKKGCSYIITYVWRNQFGWGVFLKDVDLGNCYFADRFRKVNEQPMQKLTFEQIQKEEKEEVLQLN